MTLRKAVYLSCVIFFFLAVGCSNSNNLNGYTLNDVEEAIQTSGIHFIEQPPNGILIKQDDTDLGTLQILVFTTNDEMKVEQERLKKIQANEITSKGVTIRFESIKNVMFEYKVPSTMSSIVSNISKKLKGS